MMMKIVVEAAAGETSTHRDVWKEVKVEVVTRMMRKDIPALHREAIAVVHQVMMKMMKTLAGDEVLHAMKTMMKGVDGLEIQKDIPVPQ